ncbi:MAG: hypothetical protein ABI603_01730 [Acidobacteriota bacterium]
MALDLSLDIRVNSTDAQRQLAAVERGIQGVEKASARADAPIANVAKALGGQSAQVDSLVRSTSKLEDSSRALTGALGPTAQSMTAVSDAAKSAGVSSELAAAGLGTYAAAAAALVVGVGLLKFITSSIEAFDRQTGALASSRDAVKHLGGEWDNFKALVGKEIIGNGGPQTTADAINGVAEAFHYLGPSLAGAAVMATPPLRQLGDALRDLADIGKVASMLGAGAPTAPGHPSLFQGGATGPLNLRDASAWALSATPSGPASTGRGGAGRGGAKNTVWGLPAAPFVADETYYSVVQGGYKNPFAFGPNTVRPTRSALDQRRLDGVTAQGYITHGLGIQGMPGIYLPKEAFAQAGRPRFLQASFGSGTFGHDLAGNAIGAMMGGGSVIGAIGGTVGSALGEGAVKGLFSESFLKSGLGKALGGALPVIGSLLGPLLDKVFGKLFGETQGHKDLMAGNQKIADLKKGLDDIYGSASNAQAAAKLLGVDLAGAWGSQNLAGAKHFNDLIQELAAKQAKFNDTLGTTLDKIKAWGGGVPEALQPYIKSLTDAKVLTQENIDALAELSGTGTVSWTKMQEVAEKYGISIDSLGQRFQEARLHEGWQAIIDDMDLLIRGGADAGAVLHGMADEISTLVQSSIQFGTAIPENMRPWIVQLIETGQLLDASGDKITDIGKLTFGETMQTSLQKLTETLQDLIKTLGGVPKAADDAAAGWNEAVKRTTPWPQPYGGGSGDGSGDGSAPPVATGGYVGAYGVRPFGYSGGGLVRFRPQGTDTIPAMLTPGEIVLNAAQQKRVAGVLSSGGGGQTIIIKTYLEGREVAETVVPHIPDALKRLGLR